MIFQRKAAKTARCAGIFLVLVLASALPPAVRADEGGGASPSPGLGSREKSLLFPGWGQIAERRALKGAAFAAAELACLAGAIHFNRRGDSAYAQYRAAGDAAEAVRCRTLVERHDGRRNACLLAAAAVWAANLLDIHLLLSRESAGRAPRTLTVGIAHGPSSILGLSVDCRF